MKLFTTAAAALLISAGAMQAASFDFGQDAEDFQELNGFEGTFEQVYADTGGAAVSGSISVEADAFNFYDESAEKYYTPFMDAISGGELAGLGVCSNGFDDSIDNGFGGESTCSTQYSGDMPKDTSDDNLMFAEVLGLFFNTDVYLQNLLIRDADHDLITSEEAIWINGVIYSAIDGMVQGLVELAMSSTYYFTSSFDCVQYDGDVRLKSDGEDCRATGQIYLSAMTVSEVPLPAAGWLLIGGLGGLAAMKRRKNAA